MFVKTITIFLLATTLQTEALPTKKEDITSVKQLISQKLDVLNPDNLISLIGEHSDVIEELIPSVVSVVYKLATCKADTTAMVLPHIDDIMACINITLNIYDFEIFLYHSFQLGLEVYDDALDLGSDILDCRNGSSNVFGLIECALTTLEGESSLFQGVLERISELKSEIETDYIGLADNIQKCVGASSTTLIKAWQLINNHC